VSREPAPPATAEDLLGEVIALLASACRDAWNAQCREYRALHPVPWKRLRPEPVPVVLTGREAAVLAAHRGGGLVLGGPAR
jgi:hypothetical protein